jgi:hypothetical protein
MLQSSFRFAACLLAFGISAIGAPIAAQAQSFTLLDGNARVQLFPNTDATVRVFSIDNGPDNVFRANYYYRLGETAERALSTIGNGQFMPIGSNRLDVTFQAPSFTSLVSYILQGGSAGSGRATLQESVSLTNTTAAAIALTLFDYADYDLLFNQAVPDDQAVVVQPGLIRQFDPLSTLLASTSVVPDRYEINFGLGGPVLFPILTRLNDAEPTVLSNTPAIGVPFPGTPADVSFAYQWNLTLNPGQTFVLTSQKNIEAVPEPTTIGAMVATAIGGAWLRRRRH